MLQIGDPLETLIKNFRKKTKNRKIRILSQSQSAEKFKKRDPLGFLKLQFAVKYQTNVKGGPSGAKNKIRKKVAQCRKKLKGGTL